MSHGSRLLVAGVLVVLCATAAAFGAKAAPRGGGGGGGVPLVPRWKVGDAWDVEVVRSFQDKEDGKVLRVGRFTTLVTVTVKEAGRDGFLVEWRVRGVEVPKGTEMTYQLAHAGALAADDCPLLIELSRAGNPTGLRNAADVRRCLAAAAGPLAPASAPEHERKTDEVMLRTAYKSDPALFGLVSGEMLLLTSYSGATFREGEPIRYETKLPSAMGGLIPANGAFLLSKRDAAAGTATVVSTLATDPKRTGAVVRKAMQQAVAAGAPPQPEDAVADAASVRIEDRGEHVVSTRTGWPTKFTYRRVIRTARREWLQGLWMTSTPATPRRAEREAAGQADAR